MFKILLIAVALQCINIVTSYTIPCDGPNSRYRLTPHPPNLEAGILPHETLNLLNDFAEDLEAIGGYLGRRIHRTADGIIVSINAEALSPYPPPHTMNTGASHKTEKRDNSEEGDSGGAPGDNSRDGLDANGKPFPLYTKKKDVAKCMRVLRDYVEEVPEAKEMDRDILHDENRARCCGRRTGTH